MQHRFAQIPIYIYRDSSSVFLERKIMLCSESTSEIGFQVVPHSSHHVFAFISWHFYKADRPQPSAGISTQEGIACFKVHSSPVHRNGTNLTLHHHLGSSESVKLGSQTFLFPVSILRWADMSILFPIYTQEQPTPSHSLPAPKLCQTPFVISPFRTSS